ncbi:DcaP family trimeric outer membrane transporter [Shewanella woodyi]|uniref:Porin n=1 Tax=Shewanella woodyi (strain ATCC 51908 / MS32) TaxID=392500 RepID=B1KND8_SHEWM|nr:DcaP family trimeric outer membrane transporter [Shewanella woodyi]ACA86015.1 hypothetical protein Swoo_1730 [Shewanella woodyi ATCC 51908]
MRNTNIIITFIAGSVLSISSAEAALLKTEINDWDINIGGYVKVDLIVDNNQDQGDLAFTGGLNTGDIKEERSVRIHARESRLNFTAKNDGIKAVIETDFYGNGGNQVVSNSHSLRLRLAYVESDHWMVGQNWSTFMDWIAYPKFVDFSSSPGVSFIRQSQIRYTNNNWSFSLENPELKTYMGHSNDILPDMVIKYRKQGDLFSYYAAGLIRAADITNNSGVEDTVVAAAAHLGLAVNLGAKDTISISTILGSPGRYNQEKWYSANAYIDSNGDAQAVSSSSVAVAFKHQLDDGSFNASIAQLKIDREDGLFVDTFEKSIEFHINRFWKMDNGIEYSVELQHNRKVEFNGDDANNTRLQLGVKYAF